jgi:tripeptidyl-peptidase-2
MASPCAAGGLALILSGLKAHGAAGPKDSGSGSSSSSSTDTAAAAGDTKQWISPNRVRRAVEATCQPLGGSSPDAVLTYGRGLLQVGVIEHQLGQSIDRRRVAGMLVL